MYEILGKGFIPGEADFNGPAVFRNVVRLEDIVPQAQADPEIHPVGAFRQRIGVVVKVHDRIVEDVFQRPVSQFNVGMVQVANAIELGQVRAGMIVSCESARQIIDITINRLLETRDMEIFKKKGRTEYQSTLITNYCIKG
mgnify:CR=1 FL=1